MDAVDDPARASTRRCCSGPPATRARLGEPIGVLGEVDVDDFVVQLFGGVGLALGDGALYVTGSGRALVHGG